MGKKGRDNFYELYDHEKDPHETTNLAVEKDAYEPLLHKFSRNIRSFGKGDGCIALLETTPYRISAKNKKNILVRDGDGKPDDKDRDEIPNYLDPSN